MPTNQKAKSTIKTKDQLSGITTTKLSQIIEKATASEKLWSEAKANPRAFLRSQKLVIPETVDVVFTESPVSREDGKRLGLPPNLRWHCFTTYIKSEVTGPDGTTHFIYKRTTMCVPN